nr:replicative DNA helicase [Bacteroidota bacterium]
MSAIRNNIRSIKPKGSLQASDFGKLQPQAIEIEEAVLGALMLERDAITTVLDILESDSFYRDEHKEIYAAIRALFEKSQPIDLLTVTNELRTRGKLEFIGGAFYISELTNRVGSAANIEYHARIIAQKYILRKLIEISSNIQTDAFEETTDVFDLLDRTEQELF